MKSHPPKTSVLLLASRQDEFRHATSGVWTLLMARAESAGAYALVVLVWGLVVYGLVAAIQ